MHQSCTSIHFLTFCPDVTFNDPKSPDGKSWNSALKFISRIEGWDSLQWGKRLDCEGTADFFIYWKSYNSLAAFLAKGYLEFLSLVKPIILDPDPPSPYACERHPFRPGLDHDYVSSVYELRFDSGLNETTKLDLWITEQGYRSGYQHIAAELNVSGLCPGVDIEGLFQRIDMVWLVRCPSPLPRPLEFEKLLSAAGQPGPDPKILLLITSWKNQEAEKDVNRIYQGVRNSKKDVEEPFAEDILPKATTFTRHQVALEEITEDNVAFLDSEQKWKTWMTRMFAEEDAKRRRRLGENELGQAERISIEDA